LLCAVLAPARSRQSPDGNARAQSDTRTALGFAIALYVKSASRHGVVVDAFRRDRLAELTAIVSSRLRSSPQPPCRIASAGARITSAITTHCWPPLERAWSSFVGAKQPADAFLALEWFSICLYILCAVDREPAERSGGGAQVPDHRWGSARPCCSFGVWLVYGATGAIDFPGIAAAGHEHDALLPLRPSR